MSLSSSGVSFKMNLSSSRIEVRGQISLPLATAFGEILRELELKLICFRELLEEFRRNEHCLTERMPPQFLFFACTLKCFPLRHCRTFNPIADYQVWLQDAYNCICCCDCRSGFAGMGFTVPGLRQWPQIAHDESRV
jgi:hypothetical protein